MDFSKLKTDAKRVQTGLILLAAVLLIGIFHSIYAIAAFLTIVFAAASKEALNLFQFKNNDRFWCVLILIWCAAIVYPNPIEVIFLAIIVFASIAAFLQKDLKIILPLIYPAAPLLFIFTLYAEFGISSLVWLLAIVVSCDIGAYFAGKSMGKTPFSKSSPNKTIEGVAGGVTSAAVIGSIVGLATPMTIAWIISASIIAAIASVFGDLFESYLKRLAGVKDSGNILPGHGGALDRIDGYLFAGAVLLVALHLYNSLYSIAVG